ncbi:MAG: dipeptide epimerase [Hyphomicrobiaceae bacterium]|nr:dipeptide epimerase [Hyphomicrobiaceae bacterium]
MPSRQLTCRTERYPLAQPFVISRGVKTHADVVVVEISDADGNRGRGESVPYARYGETIAGTLAAINAYQGSLDRPALHNGMAAGAARNAIDCALWDLEARQQKRRAYELAGLTSLSPVETAYTLSLDTPGAMAKAAAAVPHLQLLKLKLGGQGDDERLAAVRSARPNARLIADANEAWTDALLEPLMAAAATARVDLIEQPLPAGADADLARIAHAVPVCADESAHTTKDVAALRDRYDAVNIKLDKAGGLTEALHMLAAAQRCGLEVMVGSMVASSLAAAPALILAQSARWVDLDGPLLLAEDIANGLVIRDGWIEPPAPELWG